MDHSQPHGSVIRWGDYQLLLLASAVKRHGTGNWSAIFEELNSCSLKNGIPLALSPEACKHKFEDWREQHASCSSKSRDHEICETVLAELTKLRVTSLKRELEVFDGNIGSLERKIKRLRAERDQQQGVTVNELLVESLAPDLDQNLDPFLQGPGTRFIIADLDSSHGNQLESKCTGALPDSSQSVGPLSSRTGDSKVMVSASPDVEIVADQVTFSAANVGYRITQDEVDRDDGSTAVQPEQSACDSQSDTSPREGPKHLEQASSNSDLTVVDGAVTVLKSSIQGSNGSSLPRLDAADVQDVSLMSSPDLAYCRSVLGTNRNIKDRPVGLKDLRISHQEHRAGTLSGDSGFAVELLPVDADNSCTAKIQGDGIDDEGNPKVFSLDCKPQKISLGPFLHSNSFREAGQSRISVITLAPAADLLQGNCKGIQVCVVKDYSQSDVELHSNSILGDIQHHSGVKDIAKPSSIPSQRAWQHEGMCPVHTVSHGCAEKRERISKDLAVVAAHKQQECDDQASYAHVKVKVEERNTDRQTGWSGHSSDLRTDNPCEALQMHTTSSDLSRIPEPVPLCGSHESIGTAHEHDKDGDELLGSRDSGDSQVEKSEAGSPLDGIDDTSPNNRRSKREPRVPGKLIPLLECLRVICMHKLSPLFKQKQENQDNSRYHCLIKRHMDLSVIRARLEEGAYSGSLEFFRDMLLIFNNALVYYQKDTPEYLASKVLREVTMQEMQKIFQTEALIKQDGPATRNREPKKAADNSKAVTPNTGCDGRRKASVRLLSMDNRSTDSTLDFEDVSKSASLSAMGPSTSSRGDGPGSTEEDDEVVGRLKDVRKGIQNGTRGKVRPEVELKNGQKKARHTVSKDDESVSGHIAPLKGKGKEHEEMPYDEIRRFQRIPTKSLLRKDKELDHNAKLTVAGLIEVKPKGQSGRQQPASPEARGRPGRGSKRSGTQLSKESKRVYSQPRKRARR